MGTRPQPECENTTHTTASCSIVFEQPKTIAPDLLVERSKAYLHQPRHVQLDKFVHLRMSDHEPYIQKLQRALQVFVYPVDRHCELDQRVVGIATCDVPQTIWGDGAARFAQRALQVVHALEGLLREVHLADHALIAL